MPLNQEYYSGLHAFIKTMIEGDKNLETQRHYQATHKHSSVIRDLILIRKQNEEEARETIIELTETKPNYYEWKDFRPEWEYHFEFGQRVHDSIFEGGQVKYGYYSKGFSIPD